MENLLAKYKLEKIEDGDLFVANDPHAAGGTYLPDINLAMPVFTEGKLTAFVCNIAHHADVGGMAPGRWRAACLKSIRKVSVFPS